MTELEELRLAYAECSRQRNELLNKLKHQAQRTWVNATTWLGLTDEEIFSMMSKNLRSPEGTYFSFARDIEAKLKEKNNGN